MNIWKPEGESFEICGHPVWVTWRVNVSPVNFVNLTHKEVFYKFNTQNCAQVLYVILYFFWIEIVGYSYKSVNLKGMYTQSPP